MTIIEGQSTAESALAKHGAGGGIESEKLAAQYGWVHAVARNLVRDPWGAEDVTQETLLAALAAPPPDVPDDQRLRAWLGRVAFNLSRLGARQGARRRAREVLVARREALPSVSEEFDSAATVSELTHALGSLPELDRLVVSLRYFEGLSTAEIAARTEVSEVAVRKRLWRARGKLRAVLEHGSRNEPRGTSLWAALLPWRWFERTSRAPALGALAAGLALCFAVAWWTAGLGRDAQSPGATVARAEGDVSLRWASASVLSDDGSNGVPSVPLPSGPSRRSWRATEPESVEPAEANAEEPRAVSVQGLALDLDGRGRAGFELVDPAAPDVVLGTTDALGGFRVEVDALPVVLAARAAGWTTLVPARFERGREEEGALVVAPAEDLRGRVIDARGRGVPHARFTLLCDELAFARVEWPVRPAAELRAFGADELGGFDHVALPRGEGLRLRVERAGFEPLERSTLALAGDELFVLRALDEAPVLAGTVRFQDGRPAAGALVRLGLAATNADEHGRFRLPLVGVEPDSALFAYDQRAAPIQVRGFGARALESDGLDGDGLDVVLGADRDQIQGRLLGADVDGWLLVAYPERDASFTSAGEEQPAALAYSDAEGHFELWLARGGYAFYALAPETLQVVHQTNLESAQGAWRLEVPSTPELAALRGTVRTDDGLALADAELAIRARLDGERGSRVVTWRSVASDGEGAFGFRHDPGAAFEIAVTHAAVGHALATRAHAAPGAEQAFSAPRASYLQVAGEGMQLLAGSVLDGDGRVLATHGPLRMSERFELREGRSAVLAVSPAARWLLLEQKAGAPLRVPVELPAGRIVQVRP